MARVRVANDKGLMALVVAVLVMCGGRLVAAAEIMVPAVYVFGDSTVDVGNNGPAQLPYGIDFPAELRPTGRVSNGYNMADSFSRLLGFNMSPPAYLTLTPETSREILKGFGGVNYASSGSGILNTTRLEDKSISMAEQVEFFAATKTKMIEHDGGEGSMAIDMLLSKSLFLISAGGNDVFSALQNPLQLPTFYPRLRNKFMKHVQAMYDLGARRFGIVGVPPIGCLPLLRVATGNCVNLANVLAIEINKLLSNKMAELAADPKRPGLMYSVGSSYNVVTKFIADPESAGFKNVDSACCGAGKLGVETLCGEPNSAVCENRADYLFWDLIHSTEATANRGASIIFSAPVEEEFAAPINFEQLVSSTGGFAGFSSS